MSDLEFVFMLIGYFTSAVVGIIVLFLVADFLMLYYRTVLVKRFVDTKQMKREFDEKA